MLLAFYSSTGYIRSHPLPQTRTLMNKIHLVLGMLLLGASSCDKDSPSITDGTGNEPIDVTEEAVVGSYTVSKVESRAGGQRTDITNIWFSDYAGDCAKDDVTTFKPDASFMVLDGMTPCDESTDDTGTWKLISQTRLKIDSDTAVIEAFTATTLRIVSPIYSSAQGDVIVTYTRK